MDPTTTKLYASAPLLVPDHDLEQSLEKKLIDVNNFNNSSNNIKEMINDFEDKGHKSNYKEIKKK